METFTVVAVIDGNTLEVSPKWKFGDEMGGLVQVKGYNAPKSGKAAMAFEQKLSGLIHNKKIDLESPDGVERGRLVCDAYYRGINLAEYFSEYREQAIEELETERDKEADIYGDEELDIGEKEQEETSDRQWDT